METHQSTIGGPTLQVFKTCTYLTNPAAGVKVCKSFVSGWF
jgi:hypothetical protein